MTKLEEKLKELGYEIKREEKDTQNDFVASKKVNTDADIVIGVWDNENTDICKKKYNDYSDNLYEKYRKRKEGE